ncbi:Gamma-glutamyltranspeptidase [Gracilaria domingensis]|nr:Gamma-glutamyltranspeptidase [Gracilaria domingensis]
MSAVTDENNTVRIPLALAEDTEEEDDLDADGIIQSENQHFTPSQSRYDEGEAWEAFYNRFSQLWSKIPSSWSVERDPAIALRQVMYLIGFLSLCIFVFSVPSILYVVSPQAPTPPGTAPDLDEAASMISGPNGAVAADHPLCSELGVKVMRDMHGNAVDAMVSTVLCQGVLAPFASGLGGGAFILIHHTQSATSRFYDARETAPMAATPKLFTNASSSRFGGLAVAVPGELLGLYKAHKDWGALDWKKVVDPVIEVAESAKVGQFLGIKLKQMNETVFSSTSLRKIFTKSVPTEKTKTANDAAASVELPGVRRHLNASNDLGTVFRGVIETLEDDSVVTDANDKDQHGVSADAQNELVNDTYTTDLLGVGDDLDNVNLVKTLKAIALHGPDAFYVNLSTDIAKEVRAAGGVMTAADIKRYAVKTRNVFSSSYQGFTIIGAPPPSTGGMSIGLALNMILEMRFRKKGRNSRTYQLLAETLKWVFGARMGIGDPDFVPGADWNARRMLTRREAVKRAFRVKEDRTFDPSYYSKRISTSILEGGTSHVSILDKNGTAVSVTSSINLPFGAGLVSDSSGVLLNDQMDAFTTRLTRANAYGMYPSAENMVKGGKRPISSMCPTIILYKGEVYMIIGGSGGPKATSGVLQTVLNVLDFGDRLAESISAPRIHHQLVPNEISIEGANSTTCEEAHAFLRPNEGNGEHGWPYWKSVCVALKENGHLVVGPAVHGAVQAILAPDAVGRGEGLVYAASDPRRIGKAAAY